MRRIVQAMLMTSLLTIVVACDSDAAGPAALAEHYILESANGQDLPCGSSCCSREAVAVHWI